MRVHSTFPYLFGNRLLIRAGIAMLVAVVFCVASSFKESSARDLTAKQVNLIIRQMGHRLLLQAGDSTSRVLPVTEIAEGRFLLRFETEWVFNHDSLMLMSRELLPKTEFPAGYSVTVHDCLKGDIVYGFQLNNKSPDLLACSGRSQPAGCYTIEFAFPDLYATSASNDAGIRQVSESAKTNESAAFKTSAYPLMNVAYIGLLFLGVALLIWRFRKKPALVQTQQTEITEETVPDLPTLGKFLWSVKEQRLRLGSEVVHLTDKECKVLDLLHKNFGELIERETLMQEVWINEGVITGRSLDMFVSKLRKKLSLDPTLRITNVHGRGYKLEIAEGQGDLMT